MADEPGALVTDEMRFVGRHILATQDKLSDEECAVACYLAMHAEAPKGERAAFFAEKIFTQQAELAALRPVVDAAVAVAECLDNRGGDIWDVIFRMREAVRAWREQKR